MQKTVTTFDNNLPIFYNQLSFFMIGSGNFGGKRHTEIPAIITTENVPNDRPPDWIIAQPTTNDQAAMFRLCGDKNPLHIDSNFSKIAGKQHNRRWRWNVIFFQNSANMMNVLCDVSVNNINCDQQNEKKRQ